MSSKLLNALLRSQPNKISGTSKSISFVGSSESGSRSSFCMYKNFVRLLSSQQQQPKKHSSRASSKNQQQTQKQSKSKPKIYQTEHGLQFEKIESGDPRLG